MRRDAFALRGLNGTRLQTLLQIGHVTRKTKDKGQQEKSRMSCRCNDKETADRQKNHY